MGTQMHSRDPKRVRSRTIFQHRSISRSTLACAARLTARRGHQDELSAILARQWYQRAIAAGIPAEDCRDQISGRTGADFGGSDA